MKLTLKLLPSRQTIVKFAAFILLAYLLLVVASLTICGYIFLNLGTYQQDIQQYVYQHSGYRLQVGKIKTKLNNYYLPEIVINDISLENEVNRKQGMRINKIDLVLSYSSLWHFEPIFEQILIDGTSLKLEHNIDGSLLLNGIRVYNPDAATLANSKGLPFDLEGLLLRQHNITLEQINISYLDHKNNLPQIDINNVRLALQRHWWQQHSLIVDVYGKQYQHGIELVLRWHGGKFENWQSWQEAYLSVKAMAPKQDVVAKLQQYLPNNLTADDKFSNNTALIAELKHGRLQKLYANFDINNFQLAIANADLVNFPKLGGNLSIVLLHNKLYQIEANSLIALTSAGYLFDHSQINGNYLINKQGQIELSNTNLIALNNFLSLFAATHGLNVKGTVQLARYKWQGNIWRPKDYQFFARFNDISLASTRSEYPSLSHVSGDITVGNKKGELNLVLNNSVLNYDQVFLIPYQFKSLRSQIDWSLNEKDVLNVTLQRSYLETIDFKGWVDGVYTYDPNNAEHPSYLTMNAHVDRVKTAKVGDYLPKEIPMSVHEWLNMALIGGEGSNANMILKGPLDNFPFRDGNGLFYITCDLDNARLQYVKDWPTLDNIRGKFILKNTNITIKADSARVSNNYLDPTTVVIPDYANPDGVYLTADGHAHGATANFMEFLKHTPINEIIGKLPERIATTGNGRIKLFLKVPFSEPKHTEVAGTYEFENNNVQFDLPLPTLTHVNGSLGFSHHGVAISDLTATAFNTQAKLYASENKSGMLDFRVEAPQLDYNALAHFYLKPFASLINGRADTTVKFSIGHHGIANLTATSQLAGVSIQAPAPLFKESATQSDLSLLIQPQNENNLVINWNYGGIIHGQQIFSGHTPTSYGKIALGNASSYLANADPAAIITVNAKLPEVDIQQWVTTVDKALKADRLASQNPQPSELQLLPPQKKISREVFPLQIALSSPQLSFGKSELGVGTANIMVDSQQTYFNFYTPISSGYGRFVYAANRMDLTLDKYMLYKKTNSTLATESGHRLNFINGSKMASSAPRVPDIWLTINNLFYQNHNLGKLSTVLHQESNNLLLESGTLLSSNSEVSFSGTNYCFGCGREASYVKFDAKAKINNLGNLLYNLDLGRMALNGQGVANSSLQWNGGFQDFNPLQMAGTLNASLASGKFLKVNPGVMGGILSVINLQGVFEFGSGELADLFKTGFYFNTLDMNIDILAAQVALKHFYMAGPLAKVSSSGKANFATNKVDAKVSVIPHLGVAVAITAGVVTLNPLVAVAVFAGEELFDNPQNKLFSLNYHISGEINKPKIEKAGS